MEKRFVLFCLTLFFMTVISGCASYFKVNDPVSNKVYYTDEIKKKGNGVIQFKDKASRTQVTLPHSEVIEITKDQFEANVHSK